MQLSDWEKNWNELGQTDPLWVVLTDPSKKGGKWDPAEFFQTGQAEITRVLAQVSSLGIELGGQRALDFGCGVGRLTQALAQHVDEVDGVDISPSMVAPAQQLNRWLHKCRYHVNCRSDLQVFPDDHFDFIYSSITL